MFFNVDKIFVLGLVKNKASIQKKFSSMFPDSNIYNKIEYYFVTGSGSTQNDGLLNSSLWSILQHKTIDRISKDIFKNHIDILKKAKENNYTRILILEDDAYFTPISNNQMVAVNHWMETNTSYDMLYLGYVNWPFCWSMFHNYYIVRPKSPLTAHSYIVNKKGIDKILSLVETCPSWYEHHIDKFYSCENSIQKFGVFPMVSFQDKDPSLFIKALDKLGLYIPFSNFCRANENVSLYITYIFLLFFVYFLYFFVVFCISNIL